MAKKAEKKREYVTEEVLWRMWRTWYPKEIAGSHPTGKVNRSGDPENRPLLDLLPSSWPGPDEIAERKIRAERVWRAARLCCSDPRAVEMLKMRFVHGMTLSAIGRRFGLSRERVRQVLEISFAEIRGAMKSPENL